MQLSPKHGNTQYFWGGAVTMTVLPYTKSPVIDIPILHQRSADYKTILKKDKKDGTWDGDMNLAMIPDDRELVAR